MSPSITAHNFQVTVPGMSVVLHTASAIVPATPTGVLPSFTSQDEILKEINDPFIGDYILEIAGLKREGATRFARCPVSVF